MTLEQLLVITGAFIALDIFLLVVIAIGSSQADRREGWND